MRFKFTKQEKEIYNLAVNESNKKRAIFFTPFMVIIFLVEFIKDFSKSLLPEYSQYTLNFSNYQINSYKIFYILDALLVLFSLITFVFTIIYSKKKISWKCYSFTIITYGLLLLLISCISLLSEIIIFHSADFLFYYFVALVTISILFIKPQIIIPALLITHGIIWTFIGTTNFASSFTPYVPYSIFVLVGFCFTSVFRMNYIIGTIIRENKIKRYQEEAEKQNKLKSQFLANMSHEIRTPMNAIIGMSELAMDFDLADNEKNTIQQIQNSGKTLLSIINDILDFSKIESGKMEIAPVEYDLLKLVYEIGNITKVKIQDKPVDLIIEVDPNLPSIFYGDDLRLKQILINLVNNATKFTESGFIIIRIEEAKIDSEKFGLRFNVIDTGIGIKEENISKLFHEFQQVDKTMNRAKGGTGLGLAISKNLVQLMGGTISVKSEYGKGSCFYFELPQEPKSNVLLKEKYSKIFDQAQENKYHSELKNLSVKEFLNRPEISGLFVEKQNQLEYSFSNAKVLVVDDNDVNLQVAVGLLGKFKVNAEVCSSGFSALEKMEQKNYDIIFMDHQMPVMDGVQTLERIRQNDNLKNSIVIALSANAVNGAENFFLEKGFNGFLSKPAQGKDFCECLKKFLPSELVQKNLAAENSNQENQLALNIPADFKIPEQSKIDLKSGIQLSGDFNNWLASAKLFYNSIDENLNLIKNQLKEKDYKNFTITVHSIKSSAKIIGANELSELAKELEFLSKENQNELEEKTLNFTNLYDSYKQILLQTSTYGQKNFTEKVELSDSEIFELLKDLKDAAESFDLNNSNRILETLKSVKLPQQIEKCFDEILEAVDNLEFNKVVQLIDSFEN